MRGHHNIIRVCCGCSRQYSSVFESICINSRRNRDFGTPDHPFYLIRSSAVDNHNVVPVVSAPDRADPPYINTLRSNRTCQFQKSDIFLSHRSSSLNLFSKSQANSLFKSLIDETTTFQYRIALFASGMVDAPPGGLTPFERLELLRSSEASWKNIEWSEHNTILRPQGLAWEFYGNV